MIKRDPIFLSNEILSAARGLARSQIRWRRKYSAALKANEEHTEKHACKQCGRESQVMPYSTQVLFRDARRLKSLMDTAERKLNRAIEAMVNNELGIVPKQKTRRR